MQTDTPRGTPARIEIIEARELLQKLADRDSQPQDPPGDRGVDLVSSHHRQRNIRSQAIGWG
jgi:hypothetical protein